MTTVVTGASGHLGGNLCRALIETGVNVRATAHRDRRALEGLEMDIVQADLGDVASLRAAFDGADTVYHLAAKISIVGDPDGSVHRANVEGARNAATAALEAGVGRFVHVSSVHAFDLSSVDRLDESGPKSGAQNPAYDRSKAQGEREVQAVVRQGLDAVIVNPTGIIGPLDFKISRMGRVFLDLAQRKLPALIHGAFDFVDVRDVVAGAMKAAEVGRKGENYLLGGHRIELRDLAALAEASTGVPAPRIVLPAGLARLGVPFVAWNARRHGDTPRFTSESIDALVECPVIDTTKARRELDYRPRSTAVTVRDTYAWFRERGLIDA